MAPMKGGGLLALLSLAAAGAVIALNLPPTLPLTRSTLGPRAGVETVQPAPPAATATSWSAAAFRGLGKLAFVSHGLLYVLNGARGSLTQITHQGTAVGPAWSADGRWLAFDRSAQTAYGHGTGRLWLVRADGSDPHPVGGTAGNVGSGSYAWSPRADILAVAPPTKQPTNGLWLVPTAGPAHLLAFGADAVYSFLWSPDGAQIAVDAFDPAHKTDTLATVPESGGPTVSRFHAPRFTGLILAAWSPHGRRIAFWEDPQHSGSIALDGLQLFVLPLVGGAPLPLPATLTYRSWLSWSPDGQRLAMVEGHSRMTWTNKGVALCDPTGRGGCPTALPAPGGGDHSFAPRFDNPGVVTLDPAWSPDGRTLALVQAVGRGNVGGWGGCPQPHCSAAESQARAKQQLAAWLRTRVLWLVPADGSGARPLRGAGTGIYDPEWSAHGRHLLYIRGGAVWEVPVAGGPARRIAGPIDGTDAPYGYYGHVDWSGGWAWYR